MLEYLQPGGCIYASCMGRKDPDRSYTFLAALTLFPQFRGLTMVEVGTIRSTDDAYRRGDGYSTLLFSEMLTHRQHGHLWSIDESPDAIEIASGLVGADAPVTFVQSTSTDWFSHQTDMRIDFLYLDGQGFASTSEVEAAQESMLQEIWAAEHLFSENVIILLDDNVTPIGSKTDKAKRYLFQRGYTLLLDAYQSLWIKR